MPAQLKFSNLNPTSMLDDAYLRKERYPITQVASTQACPAHPDTLQSQRQSGPDVSACSWAGLMRAGFTTPCSAPGILMAGEAIRGGSSAPREPPRHQILPLRCSSTWAPPSSGASGSSASGRCLYRRSESAGMMLASSSQRCADCSTQTLPQFSGPAASRCL